VRPRADEDRPVTSTEPDEAPPAIPPDVPEADALDQSRAEPLDDDADAWDRDAPDEDEVGQP
jgi:hypothetical protein